MKKTISLTVVILSLIFFFSSCTKQESIDVYEYCKRYNSQYDENKINYESFFKEDNEDSCYYSFIETNEKPMLVTIKTDSDGTVAGIALTITKEGGSVSKEELLNSFNIYIQMSAVFCVKDFEEMKKALVECEIGEEDIAFEDINLSGDNGQQKFTILENSEIITMYTDRV